MTSLNTPAVRRLLRAVALTPVILVSLAAPAMAAPPEAWPETEPPSTFSMLLVLVLIPLGLVAVISLLVLVPAMARGEKYTPGQAWRGESEWFGGPRGGVAASDTTQPEAIESSEDSDRGGASGRW